MNPAEKLRHYIGIDLLFYDEHNVFLWMERERKRERKFEFKLFYIAACHTAYNSITCT